jgi:exosortase/archaeosortase family protein
MRTIEILIMTSALYAMLFYRRPFQVLLLLFLAPILGYFINLVRVLSIIFNPYSAWTSVHTAQGVIMLVIGVLLIVAADRLLEHREANLPPQAQQHPVETARSPISSRTTGLASMLVILGIGNWLLPTWQPESSSAYAYEPRALRLPLQLARSTPKGHKLDRGFLGSVGVTKWLHREYDFLDATVGVQILANDRLNGRSALVSEKTAVPGSGQSEVSHDRVQLTGGGYVNRHIYRSRDQRTLVYHWYEGTAGAAMENYQNAIVLDRGFARRNEWAVAMRLSTVVAPGVDGVVLADARLQGFAEVIRASLQRFRSN